MRFSAKLARATCALVATVALHGADAARIADVSPGPARLPASSAKYIRFDFVTHARPGETVSAAFQWNGSQPGSAGSACRFQLDPAGIRLADAAGTLPAARAKYQANDYCAISPQASATAKSASVPIAFTRRGRYSLYVHTPSSGWIRVGDYQMTADGSANLPIQIVGVTPTQTVLAFSPLNDSDACQVQVTSTRNGSKWDFATLVPDVDPYIFPGADNANLNDPDNPSQNRGYRMPDGTRAIVIGKRAAEYSVYTYRMHSRALQAATPHEAYINCGSSSGTVDFNTANIMPGTTYSDPLPADPDRPGDYAYPTLSWTDRSDSTIDPQTGILIRPVSLPSDSYQNPGFAPWSGPFGAAYPSYPSRSFFLPASIPKALPDWYGFQVSASRSGWLQADGSLTSFQPGSVQINCPLCSNTPVTICLTADGVTCAVDKNVAADPNASADPNTNQTGILGTSITCNDPCSYSFSDERWKDSSPMLASWHPNYRSGAPNTVLPSFQFDTVKLRTTQIKCGNSALVNRDTYPNGTYIGAPFSTQWHQGTPLSIDGTRYTVNQVYDENALLLNESCPSKAQTMTADTFGLLVTAPVAINRVTANPWKAKVQYGLTNWDAGGDVETFVNCSRQPVLVNGKKGWHCLLGNSAYWVAADASAALPLGTVGFAYRGDIGSIGYCLIAMWDNLDGNSLHCLFNTPNAPGKHSIVQLTFFGTHAGLDQAQFTTPDADAFNAFLPVCKATGPASPNNCWRVTPLSTTGTNSLFVIEDAIRAAAPDAWNNSPFVNASKDNAIAASINSRIDDSHWMITLGLGQNSIAINAILEYSVPRGSARITSVLPSWIAAPNAAPGSKPLRWAGMHSSSGVPWGATKVGISPTYFRGGGTGQGYYSSRVVNAERVNCPPGNPGPCISVTLDGQPGVSNPSLYEPINNAKTRKTGWGYLTDIAAGDLICAPQDNDFGSYCPNYVAAGHFEHLRVLSTTTDSDGTVILTLQRNIGGTTTIPLTTSQSLFMMASFCGYSDGYGCAATATVWDWSSNSVEQINNGGESHQFTAYDPANKQVVNVTTGSFIYQDPLCYASTPAGFSGCYSVFGGKLDSTKTISSQLPSLFNSILTINPPFGVGTATQGYTGLGNGNAVDSHPGTQQMAAAPDAEKTWFVDGRPFNGMDFPLTPPVDAAANVYRFAAAAGVDPSTYIESYKRLPMLGSCGMNPLREVTQISDQTPYSYCMALNPGDCQPNANPGDTYVSCPSVRPAAKSNACPYAGIGGYTPEVRDTCLFTVGAYTMGLTQTGFASQTNGLWTLLPADRRLRSGRLLTRGFARYRIIDQFWNPKTTPDGGVLLFRSLFLGGYSTRFMMAKIPPFPDVTQDPLDRRGFVATPATIDAAPDGTSTVKVQFGYDTNFRCITRPEACEARADFDYSGLSTPFYFASESGPDGLDCSNGCPGAVNLPVISQRVVFYRAVYQVNGASVIGLTRVAVAPDPVVVPGNGN